MSCIVVFGRQPVPGKVKTRLASAIGADAALRFTWCCWITPWPWPRRPAKRSCCRWPASPGRLGRLLGGQRSRFRATGGWVTGWRTVRRRFAEGCRRVVIVGSDCAGLSAAAPRAHSICWRSTGWCSDRRPTAATGRSASAVQGSICSRRAVVDAPDSRSPAARCSPGGGVARAGGAVRPRHRRRPVP